MTGFGRAIRTLGDKTIVCEIRALNSKAADLKIKLPADIKEREMDLRKQVNDHAERGKFDLLIDVQSPDGPVAGGINEPLFRAYFHQISRLAKELNIAQFDPFQAILRIPNVVGQASGELDEEEWHLIRETLDEALTNLRNFRRDEGKILEAEFRLRVANIVKLLKDLAPLESGRVDRMRQRLKNNAEDFLGNNAVDANRFEQEILFYLEKMDITEEKVRLEQHCSYFVEQLDSTGPASIGRTLGFISQEMGREINTLGAKAYDADLQRLVVQMKDDLEKIKEQLANVL